MDTILILEFVLGFCTGGCVLGGLGLMLGYKRGLNTARDILRETSLDRELLKHIERFP